MDTTVKPISPKHAEYVRLIARGMTTREAAATMRVSARTIKSWDQRLFAALGVAERRQIPLAYYEQTGDNPYPDRMGG